MIRKTLSTAIAVAVISGSAMFASSTPSNATYYGSYGSYGNYYGYTYYEPTCHWIWQRIWIGYRYKKIRVQVCN